MSCPHSTALPCQSIHVPLNHHPDKTTDQTIDETTDETTDDDASCKSNVRRVLLQCNTRSASQESLKTSVPFLSSSSSPSPSPSPSPSSPSSTPVCQQALPGLPGPVRINICSYTVCICVRQTNHSSQSSQKIPLYEIRRRRSLTL
jgi:hypothetical protein